METSILWYQPARLSEQDVIIHNGERVEDALKCAAYFGLIKQQADFVLKKNSPWCGKVRNFFFMKGNLDAKDELGRTMSFMYITDLPNPKEALKHDLERAGLGLASSSENCLNRNSQLTTSQIALISIAILTIVTLIIYSLSIIDK